MNLVTTYLKDRWVLIIGVVAVLCVGTAMFALRSPAEVDRNASARPVAQIETDQQTFREQFAVMRTSPNVLPHEWLIQDDKIDRNSGREIAPTNDSALRRAGGFPLTSRLWIAQRSDGSECLLAQPEGFQGPAQSCSTAKNALAGRMFMTQSRSRTDVEIYGLVPDGVDSVTIGFADGTSGQLPVSNNAYSAKFDRPTATVSFSDATGEKVEWTAGIDG